MCLKYDGEHRVVSGSYDRTAKVSTHSNANWRTDTMVGQVWDLRSPHHPVASFNAHEGALFCLEVTLFVVQSCQSDCVDEQIIVMQFDANRLVTGSADHSIKLFDFGTSNS